MIGTWSIGSFTLGYEWMNEWMNEWIVNPKHLRLYISHPGTIVRLVTKGSNLTSLFNEEHQPTQGKVPKHCFVQEEELVKGKNPIY